MSSLKDMDYPKIEIKMADGGILEKERDIFVGGRARTLINTMIFMEEEGKQVGPLKI